MKLFQKIKRLFLPKHPLLIAHKKVSQSFLKGLEEGLKK